MEFVYESDDERYLSIETVDDGRVKVQTGECSWLHPAVYLAQSDMDAFVAKWMEYRGAV